MNVISKLAEAITGVGDMEDKIEVLSQQLAKEQVLRSQSESETKRLRKELASSREEHLKTQEQLRSANQAIEEINETCDHNSDKAARCDWEKARSERYYKAACEYWNVLELICELLGTDNPCAQENFRELYSRIASLLLREDRLKKAESVDPASPFWMRSHLGFNLYSSPYVPNDRFFLVSQSTLGA